MSTTESTRYNELSAALGMGVSLVFWISFLVCGSLFAIVALAPHLVEQEDLHAQWDAQQQQRRALEAEQHHLELLRDSLQDDPEFISRITSSDLNQSPDAQFALAVPESLRHNPRHPRVTEISETSRPALPYMSLLRDLSQSSPMRTRWIWCTAIFCVISFGFLHDGVFYGPFGKLLTLVRHALRNRYHQTEDSLPTPDEQSLA